MKGKLKSFLADDNFYLASIVVGVGVLAFLLGRQSIALNTQQKFQPVNQLALCPTTLSPNPINATATSTLVPQVQGKMTTVTTLNIEKNQYVASRAGSKYHHITCPGAKQIKDENKIYFPSVEAALAAGYSKAANCNR